MPSSGASHESPPSIKQYDECMESELSNFYELSKQIGGNVSEMAVKLKSVMDAHRAFIWYASGIPEPTDLQQLNAKLGPIFSQVEAMAGFKESMKNTPLFNHLAAVAEGVHAVVWVTVVGAHVELSEFRRLTIRHCL